MRKALKMLVYFRKAGLKISEFRNVALTIPVLNKSNFIITVSQKVSFYIKFLKVSRSTIAHFYVEHGIISDCWRIELWVTLQ